MTDETDIDEPIDLIIEAEPMDEPDREGAAPPFISVADLRRVAFQSEADPVFFRWQRGEATEAEWLTAVDAVRARFPYPNDLG